MKPNPERQGNLHHTLEKPNLRQIAKEQRKKWGGDSRTKQDSPFKARRLSMRLGSLVPVYV